MGILLRDAWAILLIRGRGYSIFYASLDVLKALALALMGVTFEGPQKYL